METKPVVIVVDPVYQKAMAVFKEVNDMQLEIFPEDEPSLAAGVEKLSPKAVVLGITEYRGPLYEKMPHGGVLARFGVGYDNINLELARHHGLFVTNTPGVLDQTVAEYTLFLTAEVLRRVGQINHEFREGIWKPYLGRDLQGKTWTIAGFGHIGSRLSHILSAGFGVTVFAFDWQPFREDELKRKFGVSRYFIQFAESVRQSDIVSLHLPANQQTRNFINNTSLGFFPEHAILINTARGSLVDESALYDAITQGKIMGAGLDVFDREPYVPTDPDRDLRKLPGVVLSPHLASSTVECAERMAMRVLSNIRHALHGETDEMDLVK